MARLIFITLALLAGTACSSSPASLEQYAFVVQTDWYSNIYRSWTQSCVSNIINNLYVISAARCYVGLPFNRRIRAGSEQRHVGGDIYEIQWYRDHPSYGQGIGADGDLTLVRLQRPFRFSSLVFPGPIISPNSVIPAGLSVKHIGWRDTTNGRPIALLQEVGLISYNNDRCRELHAEHPMMPTPVTQNMICTMPAPDSPNGCKGDTGGPIVYQDIIIGLVSLAQNCVNDTYPVINTAISPYTNWIIDNAV